MSVLTETTDDGLLVVTLNRPERLNALDTPAKERLAAVWTEAAGDPRVLAIVLRGAGEKAFSVGSDIKEMQATGAMVSTDTLMRAIPGVGAALDKPVIAALHGYSIGMGLTLAIHCDFRIAAPATRLGFPEVQHGMISGVSAVTLPALVGEPRALDLMLSGRIIDAAEALAIGLVTSIAPDPFAESLALARRIARNSAHAVALTKRLVTAARRARIERLAVEIDAARQGTMRSPEYGEVVRRKPLSGRMREG